MKQIRKRLTYANVMSSLAVFLVIGGGAAFAATQLPKNSVGSKQIRKNAVNSAKVKDHSLQAADFKEGQLPAGPKGATGATGAAGPKGETGAAGSAIAYAKVNANGTVDASLSKNVTSANVEHSGTGEYCFHGLSFTPKNAMATLLNFETGEISAGVAPNDIGSACTSSNVGARIETYNDTGAIEDEAFMVIFN